MNTFFQRLTYKLLQSGFLKESLGKALRAPSNIDKQTLLLQHQFIQTLLAQPRYADAKRLNHFEQQVFSQNGEDGVIAEIFRRIGTTDKYFVEIGVGDGLENCTVRLLSQDWKGCWIDGDEIALDSVRRNFHQPLADRRLALKYALVSAENVSSLLFELNVPAQFDLLSVDIDRNTYFVWEALKKWQPRVVVVEYNSSPLADTDWKVAYDPKRHYNWTSYFGASLKAYEKLGAELGYILVGCELAGVNAFFVRKDLVGDKFAAPFTAENHYEPPRFFLVRRDGHPRCFTDILPDSKPNH